MCAKVLVALQAARSLVHPPTVRHHGMPNIAFTSYFPDYGSGDAN